MGKGTNTVTQNSSPPAGVLDAYYNLINQAQNTANNHPNYQPYGGQIVPNTNLNQDTAYGVLSNLYGLQTPYLNSATNYANQSATPINLSSSVTNPLVSPFATQGANSAIGSGQNLQGFGLNSGQNISNYGTSAGQGISNYGTNAAGGLGAYASGIGASGPQLMQYNSHNLQGFIDPYTQNVINTTSANIDRSNGIQQNNLTGSAIMGGNAFGGDRAGVAAAELARNQDLAKNQTIAGLESQGFQNAQSQFNQNNAQALSGQQTALSGMMNAANLGLGALGTGANLGLNAMGTGANLGMAGIQGGANLGLQGAQLGNNASQYAQNLALQQQQANSANARGASGLMSGLGSQNLQNVLASANAQLGAGNAQQQQQAAQLNVPYQQYLQAQAYPYQQLSWLSGLTSGLGSGAGGSSSTTSPGASPIGQIAGLGTAGLGAYNSGLLGGLGGAFNAATTTAASGMTAAELAAMTGESADTAAAALAMLPFGAKKGGRIGYDDGGSVNDDGLGGLSANPIVQYDVLNNTMNYDRSANADARHIMGYASGGLAAVQPNFDPATNPFETSKIPNLPIRMGHGLPSPPARYSEPQGLATLATQAKPMLSALNDATSKYQPNFSPESTGGLVSPTMMQQHFADGGMPDDDPFGDDKRKQALDLLRQGMGTQAPDSIPGGEPPPAPFRLDPAATEAWRKGVSSDMAAGLTAPEPADTAVAQSAPRGLARAPLPPEIASGTSAPSQALGYASTPQGLGASPPPSPEAGLQQFMPPHRQADPNMALMQAGLAMMASRNPSVLGAIGEGGQAGLRGYQEQQGALDQADQHPIIDHNGETMKVIYPSTGQIIDTHIPTITASDKARQATEKEHFAETVRHNKATEDKEFAAKVFPEINQDTGETVYKAFDPKTKQMTIVKPDGETTPAPPVQSKSGEFDYRRDAPHLEKGEKVPEPQKVPGKSADTLKSDAEYFLTTGTLPKASISGKKDSVLGMNYQNAVKNYANAVAISRGETPESIADMRKFGPQAVKFVLGKQGDQTVALGTSIRHLDSLREYAEAWKQSRGSDSPILRQAAARFAQAWGSSEPTNLQAAARIAGPEVIKAIGVAGAGSGGERIAQEEGFQPGASNEQIFGAINVAQQFLAGQLPAKEAQANALHFPHDKFVSMVGPSEYARLEALRKGSGGNPPAATTQAKPTTVTQNGHTYTLQPDGSYK
jgi:hypothetical protein